MAVGPAARESLTPAQASVTTDGIPGQPQAGQACCSVGSEKDQYRRRDHGMVTASGPEAVTVTAAVWAACPKPET